MDPALPGAPLSRIPVSAESAREKALAAARLGLSDGDAGPGVAWACGPRPILRQRDYPSRGRAHRSQRGTGPAPQLRFRGLAVDM